MIQRGADAATRGGGVFSLDRFVKALVAACAVALVGPVAAQAASYTVTTTSDSNDHACTASLCSLRDAVIAANTVGGTNTITIPAGHYTLSIAPSGTTDASTGNLDVTSGDSLSINGADASSTTIDGGGVDRVFNVASGASLTLTGATVAGGAVASADSNKDGGAILNLGTLTLSSDVITGNQAPADGAAGGGISEEGGATTTITDSTISSNTVGSSSANSATGGGLSTGPSNGTLTVSSSTFNGNVATAGTGLDAGGVGGAMFLSGGRDTITNSTLDANTAGGPFGFAGGVFVNSGLPIQFTSDTIAFNSLPDDVNAPSHGDGAGFFVNSLSSTQFRNTIVAHNTRATGNGTNVTGSESQDCGTHVHSNPGNNLDDDSTCFTGAHDVHADPQLSALASNGGPTQTLAIAATSPARDAGDAGTCPATDQRGVTRPVGSACDIGAFELDPPVNTAAPTISGSAVNLQTLSCSKGTWGGSPFQSYSYQWKRDGTAITGATSTSYMVTLADVGHQLTCSVTAATPGDGSVSATSGAVTATFPSNAFSFGKLTRHKHKGTATQTVTLAGPGKLVLKGKGVKTVRKTASGRKAKLKVALTGKQLRKLKAKGKLKVGVSVTYTPTGGRARTKHKKITLIFKR
jgi:CSLREA domain-containing protein